MNNSIVDNEATLRRASDAYYNGTPVMSDAEFDDLWKAHYTSREANPDDPVWKDTILDRVGTPAPAGGRVKHTHQMYSLDNVFVGPGGDLSELCQWMNSLAGQLLAEEEYMLAVEPKIDGLSLEIHYDYGKLKTASTRGDGLWGEDVTAQVLAAGLAPATLPERKHPLTVNGEVFMTFKAFQCLNDSLPEGEEKYANPRNAAAGILRRNDPNEVVGKGLGFVVHGCPTLHGLDHGEMSSLLKAMGFSTPDYRTLWLHSSLADVQGFKFDVAYPVDGAVLKLWRGRLREDLGYTSRAPRWAVALKFEQERVVTTLRGITVQVGRTGILCPVAELEPVWIDGSMVSRATLHNENYVNALGLYVGAKVKVEKSGAIIPRVVSLADE